MKIQFRAIPSGKLATRMTALGLLLLPGIAAAQIIPLSNNGSTATVDLGSSAGMNNWSVTEPSGPQNELNQQWFWYSINGGTVQSIDTIGGLTDTVTDHGTYDELSATYANSALTVSIDYQLQGGGVNTGNADITESIAIINNGLSSFNINFFQYSYFDLLGSGNNSLQIVGSPGQYQAITQTAMAGGDGIEETIDQPDASYAEAGTPTQVMTDVLSKNNLTGPLTAGPGNVAWSFEWSTSVGPGLDNAFSINKDKNLSIQLVPEPSTFALIGLGLGAIGFVRRRKAS